MTPEELDAIEARELATSPGPWRNDGYRVRQAAGEVMVETKHMPYYCEDSRFEQADLDFIAAAKVDVPALIAELRKAWGELRRRDLVSPHTD
jgi:hypothetical protein